MRERMVLERIEMPEFVAGRRIQGDDAQVAGRDVHHAVDHDRRAFDRFAGAALELAGVVGPGWAELCDVVARLICCSWEYRMQPGSLPTRGQSTLPGDCAKAEVVSVSRQTIETIRVRRECIVVVELVVV